MEINQTWPKTIRQARRLIILVVGLTLLLCGGIMLITPGPGVLLILAGLSVLAVEFVWARRLLKKIKAKSNELGREIGINLR
jgi:tellurite resistance protein TerC